MLIRLMGRRIRLKKEKMQGRETQGDGFGRPEREKADAARRARTKN